ncbi:helix-turn-helix domain-containing protein [Marinobacter sp.]|uniref:helix-turn-helix domain-containing protein n=1 Tax=Marinobacter sp. TaxID=50741 RepID=UPI0034A2BDC0
MAFYGSSEQSAGACTPIKFIAYYGSRRFLLIASSFLLDRSKDPYYRLSATLLFACREPFKLEIGDGTELTAHAVLIAPKVLRKRLIALNSDLFIFDIPIQSPEFMALKPVFQGREVLPLNQEAFVHLQPAMEQARRGVSSPEDIQKLLTEAVKTFAPYSPPNRVLDSRVVRVMELIHEAPLGTVNLELLAKQVHLSPSRLRHLFSEQTGSTIRHFARWSATWRVVELWSRGRALTELAFEAGFYDLAHLDHAFMEVFGLNPSTIIDPENVTLIHCL